VITASKLTLRIFLLALALAAIVPYAACVNSGIGGEGQGCNSNDLCKGDLVCCKQAPYNGACVAREDCRGSGSADGDQEFEFDRPEIETDGDQPDGDDDGDTDPTEDGDEDPEEIVEEDNPVSFPESYSGQVCSPSRICWELPWPTGYALRDIWASEEDSLWLAGDGGVRIRSDKEVFDGVQSRNVPDMNGISGADDGDVWAAGADANVWRWDGDQWSKATSPTFSNAVDDSIDFKAALADGVGNVYVLGEKGHLYRRFNDEWSRLGSTTNAITLNAIWGLPGVLYVIVADDGLTLFSTNQFSFAAPPSKPTQEDLYGVWGKDPAHIYAVGSNNAVLFYDGEKWWPFDLPAAPAEGGRAPGDPVKLHDVSGKGDEVYIVGEAGTMYELVEGENVQYKENADAPGFLKTHVWRLKETPTIDDLYGVEVTRLNEVFVIGKSGTLWATAQGYEWHIASRSTARIIDEDAGTITPQDVTALRGRFGNAYAGFADGQIFRLDLEEQEWSALGRLGPVDAPHAVNDVWVLDNTAFFFSNAIGASTNNGPVSSIADDATLNMTVEHVWGFGDGTIYAVGSRIIRFNGNTNFIEEVEGETFVSLDEPDTDGDEEEGLELPPIRNVYNWRGTWGSSLDDVWAVGDVGATAHRIPNPEAGPEYVWQTRRLDPDVDLLDVWGDEEDTIWFVGTKGSAWFYDGENFTKLNFPGVAEDVDFLRVWGTDPSHVFIVASTGDFWFASHQINFVKLDTGYKGWLAEIWGPDFNRVYMGGADGAILAAIEAFEDIPDDGADGDEEPDIDEQTDGDEDEEDLGDEEEIDEIDTEEIPDAPIDISCAAPQSGQSCSSDCVCWSNPLPLGGRINGFFATADNNVWAAGADGQLLHYDGSEWSVHLWGGPDYLDVAERTEDEIYLLTLTSIYRWNPLIPLLSEDLHTATAEYKDMDVDSAGNLYVLQANNDATTTVHKRSDADWSLIADQEDTNGFTTGIYAKDPTHIYVCGFDVYFYNGSTWNSLVKPVTSAFSRIFGIKSSNDVYTLSQYFVYHYNGTIWDTPINVGTELTQPLDIWGTAANNLYVVGKDLAGFDGVAYRYNGTIWSPLTIEPTSEITHRVLGSSATQIFVASETGWLWKGSGASFSALTEKVVAEPFEWTATVAGTEAWAGGADGLLWRNTGSVWEEVTPNPALLLPGTTHYKAAWGDVTGVLHLATDQNTMARYDTADQSWSKIDAPFDVDTIVAMGKDEVYTGPTGHVWNGATFDPLAWGAGTSARTLEELWAADDGTVFGVGPDGVLKLNGSTLGLEFDVGGAGLTQIAGASATKAYAAGKVGGSLLILRYGDPSWIDITGELPAALEPLDLYASGNLLFMLAEDDAGVQGLHVFDGYHWQQLEQAPAAGMKALWGFDEYSLYIVGEDGLILEFRAQP